METNPFNEFINMIRQEVAREIKPSFYIAKVVNTSPISIAFEGIELSSFYINSSLSDSLAAGDSVVVLREGDNFVVSEKVLKI